MIRHALKFIREQLSHWAIVGLVIVFTGFTPDHWIERGLELLHISQDVFSWWPKALDARIVIVLAGIVIIGLDLRAKKRVQPPEASDISAELEVTMDDNFQHVPIITLRVHNRGRTPYTITRIEFLTKDRWDIPDRTKLTNQRPVVPYLPRATSFIKISPEIGTVSSKAIGQTIAPRGNATIVFRLVTDHAPTYAIGLFPFHLGATLVYGKEGTRLPLPDLIVSLHRDTNISYSEYTVAQYDPNVKPGDDQAFANAALSQVHEGVICPPELLHFLKIAARMQ